MYEMCLGPHRLCPHTTYKSHLYFHSSVSGSSLKVRHLLWFQGENNGFVNLDVPCPTLLPLVWKNLDSRKCRRGWAAQLDMSLLTAEKKGLEYQREEKGREKGKAVLIPSKFRHPNLGTCLSSFASERTDALKFRVSKSYLSAYKKWMVVMFLLLFPHGWKKAEKSVKNADTVDWLSLE